MYNKLTIRDLDLQGKRALIRVDFNVPIKDGKIADHTRIQESLPTIRYALDRGAIVILASHLGRPKGERRPEFSLKPVAERLSQMLGKQVTFLPDCLGEQVQAAVRNATGGDVFMLENLRFYKEEEKNDESFARQLAALADVYINDAFGAAHRAHASTAAIAKFVRQAAMGLLMEKEVEYLSRALKSPDRPLTAVLGGAKVSDKIEVIANLINFVDNLLVGGGMAYTFQKAQGRKIGKSICEEDKLELARDLMQRAKQKGVRLVLPRDHVVSKSLEAPLSVSVAGEDIPDDWMGVDIGEETIATFTDIIRKSHTVLWNGPMGVFEVEAFSRGTSEVARAIAEVKGMTVVGGGDSVAALRKLGLYDKITHVSTGGGASIEFLAGKTLPGIAALTDKAVDGNS